MPQPLPATPTISVIVATRNRQHSLQQLLGALRGLTGGPDWELVVVNNGSTDATNLLLAAAAVDLPVVIVEEQRPGKSRALNAALRRARGEVLLFTDDDVVPDRNWLTALHKASLDYPEANVFGGRILVDHKQVPQWIIKSSNLRTILASEQDLGNQVCWFADNQYPMGPNLAVRRRLLDRGSFAWPVNLGPGTRIPLGDERAFLVQLSPRDARDRLYVPASIVHHHIGGRELRIRNCLYRCFLGGYAAGLIGRLSDGLAAGAPDKLSRVVRERLHGLASAQEMVCMLVRALGILAGSVSPFARVVYD